MPRRESSGVRKRARGRRWVWEDIQCDPLRSRPEPDGPRASPSSSPRSGNVPRHRHRHLVGQDGPLRPRPEAHRPGQPAARASPARTPAGPSRTPRTGGRASRRRSAPSPATTASTGLRGIGLSGQMHGAVCLDHDDEVLRPAILWNDGRAMAECAEIEAAFPRAREVAGNIAMPGFTAPKIAWLRKHEPAGLPAHRHRAPAEGLRPLAPDRPPRLGDVGRGRHLLARRRRARLVRRPPRRDRPHPRPHAAPRRGQRRLGRPPARARRALGRRRPGRRRRRRGRQRRGRLRRRRGAPRQRLRLDRHLGRALRLERPLLAQHRRAPCTPSATPSPTPGTRWA